MSTPHISAKSGEIAKYVLMPGDPLRAKKIAETFLEESKQFNAIRNMFGYTGKYKGISVSVMGSGMGMPSIGIYSYELYKFYDVESIIRVGSAGAYIKDLKLYDLVLASSAYSESSYGMVFGDKKAKATPSKRLNDKIIKAAKKENYDLMVAPIHSSDVFYHATNDYLKNVKKAKAVCVEMESNALFINANHFKKDAACILTISDSLITKEATNPIERQEKFMDMVKIALEAIIS